MIELGDDGTVSKILMAWLFSVSQWILYEVTSHTVLEVYEGNSKVTFALPINLTYGEFTTLGIITADVTPQYNSSESNGDSREDRDEVTFILKVYTVFCC
jgi:purine-cytosine permease-like protein